MPGKVTPIVGGLLNGGILAAVLWWMINFSWRVGGVGVLQQQPWPLSSIYACTAVGAALGLALGVLVVSVRRARSDRIAAMCERMNFQFVEEVTREQMEAYHGLCLFKRRRWHEAQNLMSGTSGGLAVELLDYEYVERGDEAETHYRQTVALLADGGRDLPRFELTPRGFLHKTVFRMAGIEGLSFEPGEYTSNWDRETIEQFRKKYFLSPPLDEVARLREKKHTKSGPAEGTEDDLKSTDSGASLRRLFNLKLIRFFVERPGWSMESDGENLAVWRSKKIVPSAQRERFIAEAIEVGRALTEACSNDSTAPDLPGSLKMTSSDDRGFSKAGVVGLFAGFILGSILGNVIAGILFFNVEDLPGVVLPLIFFGCTIGGAVLGALLGHQCRRKPGRGTGS